VEEERRQMLAHIAGDEIILGNSEAPDKQISIVHEMNVDKATATFLHDQGEHEIELIGMPEREGTGQTISTASGPRHLRYSRVQLSGFVLGEDPAGEYQCIEITAHTSGGAEIPFEDVPNLSFLVVLEPSRPPHIAGDITLGSQKDSFHIGVYDQERDESIRPKYDPESDTFKSPE
jgi:hypothetical protein